MLIHTQRGPVQVEVAGDGKPTLVLHGTPGGSDQARLATEALSLTGRIVMPSRPGYFETPLASGETPREQAQMLAALLAELRVKKIRIIAFSGGGPAGLHFAHLFPEVCERLVLVSAITKWWPRIERSLRFRILCGLLLNRAASKWLPWLAPASKRRLFQTLVPAKIREAGLRNDLCQYERREAFVSEKIQTPALIIHGEKDDVVRFSHAVHARELLPQGELRVFSKANHDLLWNHAHELGNQIREWLHAE